MFPARDAMWAVAIWRFLKFVVMLSSCAMQIQDDKVDFNKALITCKDSAATD